MVLWRIHFQLEMLPDVAELLPLPSLHSCAAAIGGAPEWPGVAAVAWHLQSQCCCGGSAGLALTHFLIHQRAQKSVRCCWCSLLVQPTGILETLPAPWPSPVCAYLCTTLPLRDALACTPRSFPAGACTVSVRPLPPLPAHLSGPATAAFASCMPCWLQGVTYAGAAVMRAVGPLLLLLSCSRLLLLKLHHKVADELPKHLQAGHNLQAVGKAGHCASCSCLLCKLWQAGLKGASFVAPVTSRRWQGWTAGMTPACDQRCQVTRLDVSKLTWCLLRPADPLQGWGVAVPSTPSTDFADKPLTVPDDLQSGVPASGPMQHRPHPCIISEVCVW